MKQIRLLLSIIMGLGLTCLSAQQTPQAQDVKMKFSEAKVLKEETTEEIRAQMRIPDTNSFMGRKKTEVSDNYRNLINDKLKKSNQLLYK